MKAYALILTGLAVLLPGKVALAGGFYKLTPYWMEYVYHLLLLGLIVVGLIVCFLVFRALKGGNLGKSWLFFFLALVVMLTRSVLATLTVFDIAFFQAAVFAGLDVLFYLLFVTGLIKYKIGLN